MGFVDYVILGWPIITRSARAGMEINTERWSDINFVSAGALVNTPWSGGAALKKAGSVGAPKTLVGPQ